MLVSGSVSLGLVTLPPSNLPRSWFPHIKSSKAKEQERKQINKWAKGPDSSQKIKCEWLKNTTTLAVRKMQIEMILQFYHTSIKMAEIKFQAKAHTNEGVEHEKHFFIAGWE